MIAAAALTLALAFLLSPPLIVLLNRSRLLDHPNIRSSHETPTARGGGIAVAVAALVGFVTVDGLTGDTRLALLFAGMGFGAVGLLDDISNISALRKLTLQVLLASFLPVPLLAGLSGSTTAWRLLLALAITIWITSYVNAFNFMDGINGISAVHAALAGGYWFVIGNALDVPSLEAGSIIICAASLGFLPFNFPIARVFLGDVGSYFLGATVAVLPIVAIGAGLPLEVVVAPLAVYLVDTGVTIIRRVRMGQIWHQPHSEHTYQQLIRRGWSHARTTAFVGSVTALVTLLATVSLGRSSTARAFADAGIAIVLSGYMVSPSLMSRQSPGSNSACAS